MSSMLRILTVTGACWLQRHPSASHWRGLGPLLVLFSAAVSTDMFEAVRAWAASFRWAMLSGDGPSGVSVVVW